MRPAIKAVVQPRGMADLRRNEIEFGATDRGRAARAAPGTRRLAQYGQTVGALRETPKVSFHFQRAALADSLALATAVARAVVQHKFRFAGSFADGQRARRAHLNTEAAEGARLGLRDGGQFLNAE